jgi:imidazolonepropionase-like amidohydrolase
MFKRAVTLTLCATAVLQGQSHVIRAGALIDSSGNIAWNQVIRIEEGKISSIASSEETPDIDLSSATVMAGWIGACLPVSDNDSVVEAENKAYRLLKSGFTTVIAPSSRLRDLIDDRLWAGPRILTHGDCSAAEKLFGMAREGTPLTPEALANVTSRAAEALGIADRTGSISPGMLADLVATKGNPLQDGAAIRNVTCVIKEGHVYLQPDGPNRRKLVLRQ